jgi:hypothetical protein
MNTHSIISFIRAYRSKEVVHALLFFLFFTLFIFKDPLFLPQGLTLLNSCIGGCQYDAGLYLWLTEALPKALFNGDWKTVNAFYPYEKTLGFSDNYLLPSILVTLFRLFHLETHVAHNIVLIGALFLNGFLTYLLSRKITTSRIPALFAGVSFELFPYFFEHAGHPQLVYAFFLPLFLLLTFMYLENPSHLRALLLGSCFTATFFTTVYYAVFQIIISSIVFLTELLLLYKKRFFKFKTLWQNFLLFLPAFIIGTTPALPLFLMYDAVKNTFGGRYLYESFAFAATPFSYLSSPSYRYILKNTATWSHSEAHLFVGITILTIILLGFLYHFKKHIHNILLLSIAIGMLVLFTIKQNSYFFSVLTWALPFCHILYSIRKDAFSERSSGYYSFHIGTLALYTFLVSLGPLGDPAAKIPHTGFFIAWYTLIPGLEGIRAISRIGAVTALALCILASIYLKDFQNFLGSRSQFFAKRKALISSVFIFLLIFENFPKLNLEYKEGGVPLFQKLKAIVDEDRASRPSKEAKDAFIVLPLSGAVDKHGRIISYKEYAFFNIQAMQQSLGLDLKLVNGYSGLRTKLHDELPKRVLHFPDEQSLHALQKIYNLRYIVVVGKFLPEEEKARIKNLFKDFPKRLTIRYENGKGDMIFEISPLKRITSSTKILLPPALCGKELYFSPVTLDCSKSRKDLMFHFDQSDTTDAASGSSETMQQLKFSLQIEAANDLGEHSKEAFNLLKTGAKNISIKTPECYYCVKPCSMTFTFYSSELNVNTCILDGFLNQ